MKITFKNEYNIQNISNYLSDSLLAKGLDIFDFETPNYTLAYYPFWVFEYHLGKKKGFGFLNGYTSEIVLDNQEYISSLKLDQIDLDKLLTFEEYRFYKPIVKKNRLELEAKAIDFINYKLPYLFEGVENKHFITETYLVYLPFWEVSGKIESPFSVQLLATNKKALSAIDVVISKIELKEDHSSSGLFSDMLSEINSPKGFFKYLGNLFLYFMKWLINVLSFFFKGKYVGVKLFILIVSILIILVLFYKL